MKVNIYNPDKKYNIIYADPPWEYKESGGGRRGTAGLPYPTMATEEICKLPIKDIAEDNSILFIWATFRKIKECIATIEAWGMSITDWLLIGQKRGRMENPAMEWDITQDKITRSV